MPNYKNTKTSSQTLLAQTQLELAKRELARRGTQQTHNLTQLSRDSLLAFTKRIVPNYEPADYQTLIIEKLEAVERGDIKRLIINVPPQHGKSTICSHSFPLWYFGKHPDNRLILASYAATLSEGFSKDIRNIIADDDEGFGQVFPTVELADDSRSRAKWEFARPNRGGLKAAGTGGGVAGFRANGVIIDDPIKNADQAASRKFREKTWEWFVKDIYTRISVEGFIVIIHTRWHTDDLTGRLLARAKKGEGEKWHVLNLPALTTDETTGELQALWPKRYPVEYLQQIKKQDLRAFNALYQGSPTDDDGYVFKREWFNQRYNPLVIEHLEFNRKVLAVDGAFKTGVANDYSAIACWAATDKRYYLIDVWAGKLELPDLKNKIIAMFTKHNPDAVLVEDASSGTAVVQELSRETSIPVIGVGTRGDSKITRAEAISPLFMAGLVELPSDAMWLDDWVEEHTGFPTMPHDDMVDTTSLALADLKANNIAHYRIRSLTDDDTDTAKVGVTSIFSEALGTTVEFDGEIWND